MYVYNAESQVIAVRKHNQLVHEYGYDGDGKRVWAKDYEGYLTTNPKMTTYIGNYYEVRVEGYLQPTGGAPSQPCTATYGAYLPLVARSVVENISYYYADGQRIAIQNNGVVSYLYGDQLGSVSAVAQADGSLLGKTWYHPWGTIRYSQGKTPTDYAYTGQMKESDIYFYNTRWYDPQLGRFMQADSIVPLQIQGTQAFDRYAYVNNNPLKFVDLSGHWACDTNGDCFIDGWVSDYKQRQEGNTCAVVSTAIGLSVLSGAIVTQSDIQLIWPLTYTGIGVPVSLQVSGVNSNFRNIEATPMEGDREAMISHLLTDEPVVFTVAMPRGMVGHTATAIGFNSGLNQLIIHDSGYGEVMYEDAWVAGWQHEIKTRYPNSDIYTRFSSFDDFQSSSNMFIQPYSFVVLRTAQRSGGSSPTGVPVHGGAGNRLFSPFLEVR